MFGKRRGAAARTPHPDPAVELKLQRIQNLQETVQRYVDLIETLRESLEDAHAEASHAERINAASAIEISMNAMDRAERMYSQIKETEQSIQQAQDLIISFSEGLSDADLSYLTGG